MIRLLWSGDSLNEFYSLVCSSCIRIYKYELKCPAKIAELSYVPKREILVLLWVIKYIKISGPQNFWQGSRAVPWSVLGNLESISVQVKLQAWELLSEQKHARRKLEEPHHLVSQAVWKHADRWLVKFWQFWIERKKELFPIHVREGGFYDNSLFTRSRSNSVRAIHDQDL